MVASLADVTSQTGLAASVVVVSGQAHPRGEVPGGGELATITDGGDDGMCANGPDTGDLHQSLSDLVLSDLGAYLLFILIDGRIESTPLGG